MNIILDFIMKNLIYHIYMETNTLINVYKETNTLINVYKETNTLINVSGCMVALQRQADWLMKYPDCSAYRSVIITNLFLKF